MAVRSAGRSGKADTTTISSMPDTNTGSNYDEHFEISQDLEKCEERGPPLDENVAKLFQNLLSKDINVEKLENLLEKLLPSENINGLKANKVNPEIWRQIAHQTKPFDVRLQNFQKLILKFLSVLSKTANTWYKHRSENDHTKLVALVYKLKKVVLDTAVLLDNANEDIWHIEGRK